MVVGSLRHAGLPEPPDTFLCRGYLAVLPPPCSILTSAASGELLKQVLGWVPQEEMIPR